MAIIQFPDPRTASPEGIVAIGGDLHPGLGAGGLPAGHLPVAGREAAAAVVLPGRARRARLRGAARAAQPAPRPPTDGAAASPSTAPSRAVIRGCADTPRPGQHGTWITPAVIAAYVRLHEMGIAHSVEAWVGDALVGGAYGVDVDGAFAAESMFYRRPNASKLALLHLIDHLRSARPRLDRRADADARTWSASGPAWCARDDFLERLHAHPRARPAPVRPRADAAVSANAARRAPASRSH